jgi:hypothetical protein
MRNFSLKLWMLVKQVKQKEKTDPYYMHDFFLIYFYHEHGFIYMKIFFSKRLLKYIFKV